jgi:hypothetical protein
MHAHNMQLSRPQRQTDLELPSPCPYPNDTNELLLLLLCCAVLLSPVTEGSHDRLHRLTRDPVHGRRKRTCHPTYAGTVYPYLIFVNNVSLVFLIKSTVQVLLLYSVPHVYVAEACCLCNTLSCCGLPCSSTVPNVAL